MKITVIGVQSALSPELPHMEHPDRSRKHPARRRRPNRSSMGQHVDNRRQTGIGAINGVVVREG